MNILCFVTGKIAGDIPPLFVNVIYVGVNSKDGRIDYNTIWNGDISHVYFDTYSLFELPGGGYWTIIRETGGEPTLPPTRWPPTTPIVITRPPTTTEGRFTVATEG